MRFVVDVIRALIRIIGFVLVLKGLAALAFMVAVLMSGPTVHSLPLGEVWYTRDPFEAFLGTPSLQLFGAIVERRINPYLWDPVIVTVLALPAWIALALVALVFLILAWVLFRLTRRRARD